MYGVYFHGPAYRVLDRVAVEDGRAIGAMATGLPPDEAPAHAETLAVPRLLELCFQTAGIWLLVRERAMALPAHLDRVAVFREEPQDGRPLFAVVEPRQGEAFDAQVVDAEGQVYLQLGGYRTVRLPEPRTLVA